MTTPTQSPEAGERKEINSLKKALREAMANYMQSEGCSCCQSVDDHKEHTKALAKLLNVPKYKDGSGYNFDKYKTQSPPSPPAGK